ncbi:hypothetical protein TNCV_1889961 [Trichonephila clavipes]|nr:hypothetical protein TNCV_1889961 [Trichonephila clavipes]
MERAAESVSLTAAQKQKACGDYFNKRIWRREIAYPIVCVNKKDGTLRLCVDFRALNSESVSDDFPMEDAVELIILLEDPISSQR